MNKHLTTEIFIERARKVHGDEYIYTKTDLEHRDEKGRVCIICPIHGEFWQKPNHHLDGCRCKRCVSSKPRKKRGFGYGAMTVEEFIQRARKIHGNKYDYSKVLYINGRTKVCIICPIHGEFWQTPENHLQGKGCKKCGFESMRNKQRKTTEEFISECIKTYGNLFDYTKSIYKGNKKDLIVKCNKCGKYFKITPHNHLTHKEGCPYCKMSKLEREIEKLLIENNIQYVYQKVFKWFIDGKSVKRADFYLPNENLVIECQGLEHFKTIDYFGGEIGYKKRVELDILKKRLCEEHGIKTIYYSDLNIEYPYEVITDKGDLMEKLKKGAENKD